jgi:hypothetical protein
VFAAINVSPASLLINDCVEGEGRGGERRGTRRRKPRMALCLGPGWAGRWGWDTDSNRNLLCASPSMPVRSSLATCRHPRNPSGYPAASLCIFTLYTPINAVRPLLCPRWFLYQRLLTMFQKHSLPCLTRLGSAQIILNFV